MREFPTRHHFQLAVTSAFLVHVLVFASVMAVVIVAAFHVISRYL